MNFAGDKAGKEKTILLGEAVNPGPHDGGRPRHGESGQARREGGLGGAWLRPAVNEGGLFCCRSQAHNRGNYRVWGGEGFNPDRGRAIGPRCTLRISAQALGATCGDCREDI